MANKVTTTDTTNKVVITPQSSKKLTIDSGDGNNLTLNQSTPNNVQITNNDVGTSLTPNNVSISPTDNNVSLSSTSTPVTINQSSTSIVTVNTVGPQGPKGNNGTDGDTLVSNDLENLRSFTGSIQTEVNNLTAATSSYLTSVPDGTISSSAQIIINESQISDLSHTDISALNTFTSSIQIKVDNLTTVTSSYALTTNISGAFNEPSGGFSTRVTTLETAGYITESTDISALNTFTGSIQTEVNNLTAATSSYITESTDISALNTFTGSIQTEVDSLTAATSSYLTEATDISSLNTFTGSIQTEVDNLTAITSSYALNSSISGAFAEPSGGFSNRITTIETNNTGTNTGDQDLSLYALIANISGAFNEPSSSFSTRVTTLETAGYLTSPITTSSITDFNTEVSRSAAAAGFGTGGEDPTDISALNTFTSSIQTEVDNLTTVTGSYALTSSISGAFNEASSSFSTRITTLEGSNFTPSLSTDIEARNITASGNISASGNITASNIQVANDVELSQYSKIFVGTNTTEISANGDDYWIVKANGIRVVDFKNSGVVINEGGAAQADFRVESDTNSHLLFTDAGANKVAIGTDTVSNSLLTVEGDISASGNLDINQITSSGAVDIGGILSIPGIVNVSASIAAAVAGTGADWNVNLSNIPSGLISESQQITDLGFISESADISALNTFTGSIQTEVNNLTAETSSYLIELPNGLISESAQFTTSDNFNVGQITSSKLFINPSNGNAEIILDASNSNYSSQIKFSSLGSTPSWILGMDSANPQDFRIIKGSVLNNTSGIYITGSTGYVGLGSLTPYERLTVVGNISASGIVYGSTGSFSHLEGNSPITVKDVITFQNNATFAGSKLTTADIDITGGSFKLGNGTFTSSSLAAAVGGGGDNLGNHTADTDLNMSNNAIISASSITAVSLTGSISISSIEGFDDSVNSLAQTVFDNRDLDSIDVLNTFTGSIQTEVDNLTAVTGSYALTSSISGAFAEPSSSFSTRVTTLETAGYITEATDISSLNTFTGSIQTEVDSLIAATSSYLTESTDISSLNIFTSSIQTEVDSLTAATSSYLTSPIATSSITDFNTEVSRSAAAAGFGAGDGGGFTPSLSTDIEARNITASGVIETNKIVSGSGKTEIDLNASFSSIGIKVNNTDAYRFFANTFRPHQSGKDLGSSTSIYRWDNFYVNNIDVTNNITASGDISASGNFIGNSLILAGGDGIFTSASLASAIAGADNLGNHTASLDLNMGNNAITNVSNVDGVDIATLKSDFDTLLPITTASITNFPTEVSRSAAAAGFGTGGFNPTDISALNTFTGSIQTEVDNLTAVTSSYALTSSISGAFAEPSSSFSTRVTTLETAGYITEATDISSLNIFTGSIQTEVDNLTAATSSYLTSPITTSSITDFNTEVSRSAAAAGFGTEGGGGFTPSLSTDIEARNITASNITASGNISASGDISTSGDISVVGSLKLVGNSTTSRIGFSPFGLVDDQFISGFGNQITIDGDNYIELIADNEVKINAPKLGIGIIYSADNVSQVPEALTVEGNISASGDLIIRSITGSIATSSIENFNTEVSRSAAAAGFGTEGEGTPTDISALNIFTGSIQTEVDNLTAATSSYLTSPITTSSITNFPTEVSRSAAAAGFGTGGEGGFTPSLSTDITALNITASANISASGNFIGNGLVLAGGDGVFTSASLASAIAGSDNLGNHTATTNLDLDGNSIHAALHITASGNISASGEITATSFNITGQAADLSIVEGTNELILSSSDVVTVKSPVLNLSSSFGITTGSVVSPYNGYIIYDNDQHKFFGYANGGWVALH